MDISALIASFATGGSYVVTRAAQASYSNRGRTTDGAKTTFSITASVSPSTGNDLKRLPEGRRSAEARTIYTDTMLMVGGQGDSFEADVIAIDGDSWEIQHVETWRDPRSGAVGYKCIVMSMSG